MTSALLFNGKFQHQKRLQIEQEALFHSNKKLYFDYGICEEIQEHNNTQESIFYCTDL